MGKRNENNVCHIQYKNYVNVNLTAVRSYFILLKREKKNSSHTTFYLIVLSMTKF